MTGAPPPIGITRLPHRSSTWRVVRLAAGRAGGARQSIGSVGWFIASSVDRETGDVLARMWREVVTFAPHLDRHPGGVADDDVERRRSFDHVFRTGRAVL